MVVLGVSSHLNSSRHKHFHKLTEISSFRHNGCKGRSVKVVAPGIDDLRDFNFNDMGSSLSWRLQ
jgi:hypothetical protein